MTTRRRRRPARLEVSAGCCVAQVEFDATPGRVTVQHADDCVEPDPAAVAEGVAQAVADRLGVPIVAVW